MKKDKLYIDSHDIDKLTQLCEQNRDLISRYNTETIKGEGYNTENIFHVTVCHETVAGHEKHQDWYQFHICNKTQMMLFCEFMANERAARDSLQKVFDDQNKAACWLGVYNEFYSLTSKGSQMVSIKEGIDE